MPGPAVSERRLPSTLGCALLQVLIRHPQSGYDVKRRFDTSVGRGWHAYDTQIYRELKALEANGYVSGQTVKGRSGPQRRLYAITDQGKEALVDWLASPLVVSKLKDEVALRIWSADLFSRQSLEEFLADVQQQLSEALSDLRAARQALAEEYGEPNTPWGSAVSARQFAIDYQAGVVQAKLDWVTSVLDLSRSSETTDSPGHAGAAESGAVS